MTHHAPGRFRPLAAVAVAALAATVLLGCNSSDDETGTGQIDTAWRLRVLTGANLRGVSVDMTHGTEFVVQDVASTGQFASATCQSNVQSGRARFSCAITVDLDAPFDGWLLTLRHDATVDPLSGVDSLSCLGSLEDGTTLPVACDLH